MVRTYGANNGSLGGVFAQNKVRFFLQTKTFGFLFPFFTLKCPKFVNFCRCVYFTEEKITVHFTVYNGAFINGICFVCGGCFAFGLDDPSWIVNWSFIDFAGRDFKQNIYYCFALTSPETKAQIA